MGVFKNIKISAKILALVVFMEIIIIIASVHGVSVMRDTADEYQRIYNEDTRAAIIGHEMQVNMIKVGFYMTRISNSTDMGAKSNMLANMNKFVAEAENNLAELEKCGGSDTVKNAVAAMKATYPEFKTKAAAAGQAGMNPEVVDNSAIMTFQDTAVKLEKSIAEIAENSQVMAADAMTAMDETIAREYYIYGVMSVLMVVISLGVGWMLAQHLSARIKEITDAAAKIADGDLTTQVSNSSGDEIGDAAANFEIMRQRMHESISDIRVAADQVAAGSKNVSEASVNLSQGAAEQASSVEQLSASIAEISSQTTSNATNANRANELADLAQKHADIGNTEMKNMLTAMEEINVSSANISKIIKVIDEIAFQTNILALNAAVEAARAGQHGKGFAVVAEEVRNLAARSAKAAKETTDLIEGSIEKVNGGREIANKTAAALSTIVGNVAEVADIVSSIAKASNEQKIALEQINQGVLQVSQVVQANSATSEEAASASEELNAQAQRMKETTARFKVNTSAPMMSSDFTGNMQMPRVQTVQPLRSKGMSGAKPVAPGVKPKTIALTEDEGFGKY